MGRPRKKQSFAFPLKDQAPLTDAEIDAEIDGVASLIPTPSSRKDRTKKLEEENAEKKKEVQLIKDIPQIFTPEQVAWVFDVYVGLICFVFSILLKCEFKLLFEELELDQDVKLAWAKPLAKVASKYAPSEWAGMTAEIELIASVGLWTATAFGRAKVTIAKEIQKREEEARRPRNAVTVPRDAAQAV